MCEISGLVTYSTLCFHPPPPAETDESLWNIPLTLVLLSWIRSFGNYQRISGKYFELDYDVMWEIINFIITVITQ